MMSEEECLALANFGIKALVHITNIGCWNMCLNCKEA